MVRTLDESLSLFKDKVLDCVKSKRSISVITHRDCDGLASGSIITKALIRADAKCTVRTVKELNEDTIKSFKTDSRDFHIITDLGGGFAEQLDKTLKDEWIVLDHHPVSEKEVENQNVINSWKYEIDGGMEICAGGMAYLASMAMDEKNSDLSAIAVVAALGDRQDQGEKRSLVGKNFEIADAAKKQELLEIDLDLLLVGRETKPLADALALTSQPFIEGLAGNRDACLALLESEIKLKDKGKWRVPAELEESEKSQVVELITKFASGKNIAEITSDLIGYTYTFPREDRKRFLRDGREFSTMLNACGRINHSGIGISICMGDRSSGILDKSETVLTEYRDIIKECMNVLSNQRWRISENETCIMINGEDVVQDTMTGTITSLMAGSPKNSDKIIILRAKSDKDTIKFSSKKSIGCRSKIDLSDVMQKGAEKFGGRGGGQNDTTGRAEITRDKLEEFLKYLEANVINV